MSGALGAIDVSAILKFVLNYRRISFFSLPPIVSRLSVVEPCFFFYFFFPNFKAYPMVCAHRRTSQGYSASPMELK